MKKGKRSLIFAVLAMISLCCWIGTAAYNWGYMQSAIDHHAAYFSAPAWVAVFSGIPFAIAAVVFAIVAVFIRNDK